MRVANSAHWALGEAGAAANIEPYRKVTPISWAVGVSLFAGLLASACGGVRNEFTIRADSVVVSHSATPGYALVRVVGTVFDGCSSLKRVEKSSQQDTLVRRMIGESKSGSCIQRPMTVEHLELVATSPARKVVYVVRQDDGSRLTTSITFPLP